MKVYIVLKDNGEEYEDYSQWIEKVFDTREKAQRFVREEKSKKENKSNMYQNEQGFDIEEKEVQS